MIGALGFTTPALLLALIALPILWWLLRAVPPAPIKRRFPGVALLLGLKDDENESDKTPWWLLMLRMLAVAAAILGFAGPVLNPDDRQPGTGPLLIVMDGSWASARDWSARLERAGLLLEEAGRDGRPAALVMLTDLPVAQMSFQTADTALARLPNLVPQPYAPDMAAALAFATGLEGAMDTVWFTDGVARDGQTDLYEALADLGAVTLVQSDRPLVALGPARFEDGEIALHLDRLAAGADASLDVIAHGLDPAGISRELARGNVTFEASDTRAELRFDLPPELRNRITRFEIAGRRHAGAVSLSDDTLQRREVALLAGGAEREGQQLLSPLHYLRRALSPSTEMLEGTLQDMILASPDVVILADVARLSSGEEAELTQWVEDGGLLVRFAGPRLAGSDVARLEAEPLMPVRLREGGRTVGGAMSWGAPKTLQSFAETSPFYGLDIPEDVLVESQVLAQPDPQLAARTIASLADGTPLVTRSRLGQGSVVLFHVTANADWSNLPLSGLFVDMLERLAISARPAAPDAATLAGTTWVPETLLDGFGALRDAGILPGVAGERLAEAPLSADLMPGLYAGADRRIARNVIAQDTRIAAASWPATATLIGLEVIEPSDLTAALLTMAMVLLMADVLAALWLSGRLSNVVRAAPLLLVALGAPQVAEAQTSDPVADDVLAQLATTEVTLAYVRTGDARIDEVSHAGLLGLTNTLFQRTSVEPAEPYGIELERDELSFFPMLYWPITENQPLPSPEAYARLNAYLRGGGLIVFDTRDAHLGGFGAGTLAGQRLQAIARPLDIPPLEPIPLDHVLTRTFYLLQDFPGRHAGRSVWVEAAAAEAETVEGMPFRNLNDGVTPVVIGGNDWAAAWAVDGTGRPLLPVGTGFTGERQREIALRFGVNLVMHVLSGNYKSDQVHVPALLDRLGQ